MGEFNIFYPNVSILETSRWFSLIFSCNQFESRWSYRSQSNIMNFCFKSIHRSSLHDQWVSHNRVISRFAGYGNEIELDCNFESLAIISIFKIYWTRPLLFTLHKAMQQSLIKNYSLLRPTSNQSYRDANWN